VHCLVERSR